MGNGSIRRRSVVLNFEILTDSMTDGGACFSYPGGGLMVIDPDEEDASVATLTYRFASFLKDEETVVDYLDL
jgi:hypothetical protein